MQERMPSPRADVIDGTWSHLNGLIADVPCWTCRRRRLRCDNLKPACVKCTRAGLQCLGYGPQRPLVWVGLGRRGKAAASNVVDGAAPSPTTSHRHPRALPRRPAIAPPASPGEAASPAVSAEDASSCPGAPSTHQEGEPAVAGDRGIVRSPADPLLVNYDSKALEYVRYYEQRCCMECSIYDENSVNPFRQFLLLMQLSPLVHHTIVSLAAHHRASCANTLAWPGRFSSWPGNTRAEADAEMPRQLLSSPHYADALSHKRRAIQHLRVALTGADHSDAVIVSTLLLIWVELLESGYKSWRYHLGGMSGLLCSRSSPGPADSVDSTEVPPWASGTLWSFDKYFEEVYVILQTFGSTLSREKADLSEIFNDAVLDAILRRAEIRSWTGCPAELLRILCGFNSVYVGATRDHHADSDTEAKAAALFERLERFSCLDWATSYPEPNQVEQRNHLASAYKAAIAIYGRRGVPGLRAEDDGMDRHVQTVVSNLQRINAQDSHFKGCLWPAFVAGAEARDVSHRLVVMSILLNMYDLLHTRNVERGMQALERIWRQSKAPGQKPWIDFLYDEGEELLLV